MARTYKSPSTRLALIALLGLFAVVGCSSENNQSESPSQPQQQPSADKTAQSQSASEPFAAAQQKLVGLWWGRPSLAEEQARQAIESEADENVRNRILDNARLFLSTEMAMQLSADGSMEQEVEVVINGKPQKISGTGTWRVIDQRDNNTVIVEVVEIAANGTSTTTQRLFQLGADNQRFLMPAPVIDELTKFNAVMVFDRIPDQPDSRTAAQPAAQPMH